MGCYITIVLRCPLKIHVIGHNLNLYSHLRNTEPSPVHQSGADVLPVHFHHDGVQSNRHIHPVRQKHTTGQLNRLSSKGLM